MRSPDDKRPLNIVVLIRTNPFESPRGVEALRMALGLGSGTNRVEIILMGESPFLLEEGRENVLESETLEKYLPSFEDSETPFYIEEGFLLNHPDFETPYPYESVSMSKIAEKVASGEKFLFF